MAKRKEPTAIDECLRRARIWTANAEETIQSWQGNHIGTATSARVLLEAAQQIKNAQDFLALAKRGIKAQALKLERSV